MNVHAFLMLTLAYGFYKIRWFIGFAEQIVQGKILTKKGESVSNGNQIQLLRKSTAIWI